MPALIWSSRVLPSSPSVTPVVVLTVTFLERPFLKRPDEVSVAASATLLLAASSSASSPSGLVYETDAIRRRRVVCGAWLESNGSVRIKVARDSLYCCWDPALLLFHSRRALPPHGLLIHTRLLSDRAVVRCGHLRRHLVHGDLAVRVWLCTISWRIPCVAGTRRVHVVAAIHGSRMTRGLVRLVRHGIGTLRSRVGLCLSLLCPLLAQGLSLLLLLRTRRGRPVEGASLEVHWRDERTGELGLSDERVQLRLLW